MHRRRLVSGLTGAGLGLALPASGQPARDGASSMLGDARGNGTERINLMTFNIRLDLASDGPNAWPHRHGFVASMLRFHDVDIAGVQEALSHQLSELTRDAPEYRFVGVGRDDGRQAGEFSAILYRHDRFEVVDSGTFWLSATPEAPGSRGWDAAFPRVATWAKLRDRRSGAALLVVNTHFDHRGDVARRESAALLASWMSDPARNGPAVLLGDFNCTSASDAYRTVTVKGDLVDSASLCATPHHGPSFTFQGFDFSARSGETIDFVFLRKHSGLTVVRHGTLADHWDGRYPSDHFPVLVELLLAPGRG